MFKKRKSCKNNNDSGSKVDDSNLKTVHDDVLNTKLKNAVLNETLDLRSKLKSNIHNAQGGQLPSSKDIMPTSSSLKRTLRKIAPDAAVDLVEEQKNSVVGPTKQSLSLANVRKISNVDYNPEICKDYKETGYCGFGDTCIFIHDRSNYKEGWQIEKEWNELQKRKEERKLREMEGLSDHSEHSDDSVTSSDSESGLPFSCHICRLAWTESSSEPIETRCGHFFCESCISQRYKTQVSCPICHEPLYGIFNRAKIIIERFLNK